MIYRIPVMFIQGTLVDVDNKPKFRRLESRLQAIIKKEKDFYGIKGKGYKIKYDLENQWYPIFIFTNRWLAADFIELLAEFIYKPKFCKCKIKKPSASSICEVCDGIVD
jgi:hypothetical protein